MEQSICSEIGRTSLGNTVRLPLDRDLSHLETFINEFSISDQTDVLCLSEFLQRRFELREDDSLEAKANRNIFEILFERFLDGIFQEDLNRRNLVTSIDRVNYGRSLCHAAYRD